jgi:uncharacterized protein (DUF608 family)
MKRDYNGIYENENTSYINFPLGGIGAGSYCISGTGTPNGFSLRNTPDIFSKPNIFAAISVKSGEGRTARILEGQIPKHEIFTPGGAGNGSHGKNYGLPRFKSNTFKSRFPYASLQFSDYSIPLDSSIRAWSPFIPGDSYNSSLPAATLEYTFKNNSDKPVEAVYYFCSFNFMKTGNNAGYVKAEKGGFILGQKEAQNEPWHKGEFYLFTDEPRAVINTKFFRGGWFDTLTMLWNGIEKGEHTKAFEPYGDSAGGYIAVPFELKPGETKTIKIHTCWYIGESNLRNGPTLENEDPGVSGSYKPWYSGQFADVLEVG